MSIESADNILHVKNSTMRISRVEVGQTFSVGNIEFDTTTTLASVTSNGNNTTPHTISSSNVTTGLATTANVVVGGDLIVGGTSLVNAIYPVGTVIDRATAITDTHLNGKYKAFLSAPEQEWELVDDGTNTVILENLLQSGETTSFCGRATLTPATAIQGLTDGGYTVITGSEITNFTPVLGTKKIKYSFQFHHANSDASGLGNYNLEVKIDSGSWITIPDTNISAFADNYYNAITEMAWVITLDDIDDVSSGRTTAVRPVLGLRVTGREWSSAHEAYVHKSRYYRDSSGTSIEIFKPPLLEVKCLGPKANLEYKRTL